MRRHRHRTAQRAQRAIASPKPLALIVALTAAGLIAASGASAEQSKVGDVIVSLQGKIAPHSLPRHRQVPVAVRVHSGIRVLGGKQPPALRGITIGLNREGRLDTRGLPICRPRLLEGTNSRQALSRCRGALVGYGKLAANIEFPGAPFPAQGRLLAFNGRARGRPVIFTHIYGATPVPTTLVLRFSLQHRKRGPFGTVLNMRLPVIAGNWGYVTDIDMTIRRRYRHRGVRRGFLNASCPAPRGFPGTVFTLARATYRFSDGSRTTTSLTRTCQVRR